MVTMPPVAVLGVAMMALSPNTGISLAFALMSPTTPVPAAFTASIVSLFSARGALAAPFTRPQYAESVTRRAIAAQFRSPVGEIAISFLLVKLIGRTLPADYG